MRLSVVPIYAQCVVGADIRIFAVQVVAHIHKRVAFFYVAAAAAAFRIYAVCVHEIFPVRRTRARLVAVADHIYARTLACAVAFAAVGAVAAPVIYDIVAVVDDAPVRHAVVVFVDVRMVETRVAAVVMGEHIVVEAGIAAAPDATVAVVSLAVNAAAQTFRENAPLHSEIFVCVERGALVYAPAH